MFAANRDQNRCPVSRRAAHHHNGKVAKLDSVAGYGVGANLVNPRSRRVERPSVLSQRMMAWWP
jgi:hypothetical protein